MRTDPNNMEAIQALWKMALNAQDSKVASAVTSLLLQVHTNVDFGLEHKIPVAEEQFVQSCINMIRQETDAI